MAGLVPAIHVLGAENVDARDKPGHDEVEISDTLGGLP
jgi:DNA replication and repair protein RecF